MVFAYSLYIFLDSCHLAIPILLFRPKSAPQSKLASEMEKDSEADTITKLPTERPSTSKSIGKTDSRQTPISKVFEPNY